MLSETQPLPVRRMRVPRLIRAQGDGGRSTDPAVAPVTIATLPRRSASGAGIEAVKCVFKKAKGGMLWPGPYFCEGVDMASEEQWAMEMLVDRRPTNRQPGRTRRRRRPRPSASAASSEPAFSAAAAVRPAPTLHLRALA
jgi:hypothetical protein